VLDWWAFSAADQLRRQCWLEARTENNGDTSYRWTQQAEMALYLSALTDMAGREN
jgi:hypothetical protein